MQCSFQSRHSHTRPNSAAGKTLPTPPPWRHPAREPRCSGPPQSRKGSLLSKAAHQQDHIQQKQPSPTSQRAFQTSSYLAFSQAPPPRAMSMARHRAVTGRCPSIQGCGVLFHPKSPLNPIRISPWNSQQLFPSKPSHGLFPLPNASSTQDKQNCPTKQQTNPSPPSNEFNRHSMPRSFRYGLALSSSARPNVRDGEHDAARTGASSTSPRASKAGTSAPPGVR